MNRWILGISAFYHDSAAVLLRDEEIIAAVQEERFTRKKNDDTFPENAIRYCLDLGGIGLDKLESVVFYDKPFIKFERLLETYLAVVPRGFWSFQKSLPLWLGGKLFQKKDILNRLSKIGGKNRLADERLLFSEHHLSHAASAYFPSPFDEAIILTLDGVGEWATSAVSVGHKEKIQLLREIHFPHSLGLLYSAATYYLGFKVNSGEYKAMGLAPYGTPRFAEKILASMIDVKDDGSFRLNMEFFNYCSGLTMTTKKFHHFFNGVPRKPDETITQHHMDIAASFQKVLEYVVLKMTRSLAREFAIPNLCLAGGVALNCVANGKILREGAFKNIWIQPAAGDAGGALGAAYVAYFARPGVTMQRKGDSGDLMKGAYLGPEFSQGHIEEILNKLGGKYEVLSEEELIDQTVDALCRQSTVGWFQGRMEFGPRALGNRSILADARNPKMQEILNEKVKNRENFRPFAPSVLSGDAAKWFDIDSASPYMLFVADVLEEHRLKTTEGEEGGIGFDKLNIVRSKIPAVTHVDCSARVQTVNPDINPRYYKLISAFKKLTGVPMLINTSFNVRGEPIVCSPDEAYKCFMRTGVDLLVIGNCVLRKGDQDLRNIARFRESFSPD